MRITEGPTRDYIAGFNRVLAPKAKTTLEISFDGMGIPGRLVFATSVTGVLVHELRWKDDAFGLSRMVLPDTPLPAELFHAGNESPFHSSVWYGMFRYELRKVPVELVLENVLDRENRVQGGIIFAIAVTVYEGGPLRDERGRFIKYPGPTIRRD